MQEYYTINHIALITGLTSRTIRNYMKMEFLSGEMINGVWHFTAEQVNAFMSHPTVAPSIRSRRNALISDFLSDDNRNAREMCSMIDVPATLQEANAVSEFFCHAISADYPDSMRFAFSFNGTNLCVILKGNENSVHDLMNRYHYRR